MPPRTVAEKMGLHAGWRTHLVDAPPDALAAIDLPDLDVVARLSGAFDYLHLFVVARDDLRTQLARLVPHLAPSGKLWVSWPKGGRLGTDLALPSVIETGYDAGLVESTSLRIDETWSGLRFTHPKPGKVYANSFGTLPGQR